jgi:hypothetical protein
MLNQYSKRYRMEAGQELEKLRLENTVLKEMFNQSFQGELLNKQYFEKEEDKNLALRAYLVEATELLTEIYNWTKFKGIPWARRTKKFLDQANWGKCADPDCMFCSLEDELQHGDL